MKTLNSMSPMQEYKLARAINRAIPGHRVTSCAAAPVVFAAIRAAKLRRRDAASSPCDVPHRASDEPRRRMSLSSALAPSSLASPSIRRVFFVVSALADVSSARLTLSAYPPERSGVAEGELNAGCKSAAWSRQDLIATVNYHSSGSL